MPYSVLIEKNTYAVVPPFRIRRWSRYTSIDLLRGVVMIIMALDHVRAYFHKDAFHYDPLNVDATTPEVFFTRWITHYCAPVFIFLAGLSAYLSGAGKTKKQLSGFLLTRGLWLIFAELVIVSLGWTFNPSYPVINLQVIWAIGFCMIAMSALIYLDLRIILVIGIALVAGHNLLDSIHHPSAIWAFLHEPREYLFGEHNVVFRYPVLPWIGVMAVGYYFGRFYEPAFRPEYRKLILTTAGVFFIALFVCLRSINVYGDTAHWSLFTEPNMTLMSFLAVTKYPPSLLYALITLGPAMIFLAYSEDTMNALSERIAAIGRVPMFYYIIHIYLIHFLAMIGAEACGFSWLDMVLNDRLNRVEYLKGYGFTLSTVYFVWVITVLMLYPLCKWYDNYKRRYKYWWMKYV